MWRKKTRIRSCYVSCRDESYQSVKLKSVKVFFPERGHSLLPLNRVFGLIKRKVKKSDRLYTIDEYVNIISSSSDNPDKFKIVLVDSTTIFDFQNWYQQYFIKQTNAFESRVGFHKDQKYFQFLFIIILSTIHVIQWFYRPLCT